MNPALLLVLKWSIAAMIFAIGMHATLKDLSYLWQRPLLFLQSLLAMYVVVPLLAFLAVRYLPLPRPAEAALLVLAISAGAPLLPRKLVELGNSEYVFSLVVTTSLLAIVTVPAWLTVLGPYFSRPPEMSASDVALTIGKSFLLPLALGMLIRWIIGPQAERAGDLGLKIVGAVFALAAILLLVTNIGLLHEAGWVAALSLAAFSLVSLVVGHALGGPDDANRTALAVSCATRHVGLAVLIAAAVPGPQTGAFVIAYLLASLIVSIPYLKLRTRKIANEGSQ